MNIEPSPVRKYDLLKAIFIYSIPVAATVVFIVYQRGLAANLPILMEHFDRAVTP